MQLKQLKVKSTRIIDLGGASSRMVKAKEEPYNREAQVSPIDIYVGSRIRLRRIWSGLTQDQIGESLGLTFQQIQKYERGLNRVGASRLYEFSRILGVSVSYFFDDMPEDISKTPVSGRRGRMAATEQHYKNQIIDAIRDYASERKSLELIRIYNSIPDKVVRHRLFNLMKSMSSRDIIKSLRDTKIAL